MTCDGGQGRDEGQHARTRWGGNHVTVEHHAVRRGSMIRSGGGAHLEATTGVRDATRRAGAAVRARTGAPRIAARLEAIDCCIV